MWIMDTKYITADSIRMKFTFLRKQLQNQMDQKCVLRDKLHNFQFNLHQTPTGGSREEGEEGMRSGSASGWKENTTLNRFMRKGENKLNITHER